MDVELSICIPIRDELLCVPNGRSIHLIENGHVPLCYLGLDGFEGMVFIN